MRLLAYMLFLLPLAAQAPQEGPPQAGGRGMSEPKNLKILKPEELMTTMRTFTSGLGVRCEFCHVQGDFASDDKRAKTAARNMLAMTQQINTNFRSPRVTCYTCHRGETEPKSAPTAPAAAAVAPGQ